MGLPGWYALWSPALSFWSLGASADEVGPGPLRAAGGGGAALLGALFCPAEVRDGILGASRDGASEMVDGRQERKEDGGLDRGARLEGLLVRCRGAVCALVLLSLELAARRGRTAKTKAAASDCLRRRRRRRRRQAAAAALALERPERHLHTFKALVQNEREPGKPETGLRESLTFTDNCSRRRSSRSLCEEARARRGTDALRYTLC